MKKSIRKILESIVYDEPFLTEIGIDATSHRLTAVWTCKYCEADLTAVSNPDSQKAHKRDCPYIIARKILKKSK